MRKPGFTIVELLAVIGIVALLVGTLLPVLSAAREAARCSTCLSNLRSLMIGAQLYAQEHDDWLPAAEPPLREFPHIQHWFMNPTLMMQIGVEVRLKEAGLPVGPPMAGTVLICPSHAAPDRWRDGTRLDYGLSYAANGTWGLGGRPDHLEQRQITEFRRTAEVMAFVDACGVGLAPGIVLYHGCPKDNFAFRHHHRANVAFLDAHAEPLAEARVPFGMTRRYEAFWSATHPTQPE